MYTHTFRIFWLLCGLHFGVALFFKLIIGINIESHVQVGSWDWYWQAVPTANLLAHPLRSIWYFHAQPPVFNLLSALLMRLFFPEHLQALQYTYMVMGALIVGMSYVILLSFTHSRKLALCIALILAMHPALFLNEAYIVYDILVAFEITTLVFLLAVYQLSMPTMRIRYLVAFLIVLTLLLLTRSFYHLLFLPLSMVMVCVLAGKHWRRLLIVGLCCTLLPLGWYAKNYYHVGQFGASTWLGIGLWKIASASYSPLELRTLADQGVIDPVVAEVTAYSFPSRYIDYGFAAVTDNAEWERDDFNNINIPAISKVYQTNSLRLIRHDPVRYVQAITSAYFYFSEPASRFYHLEMNLDKIRRYEMIYADIFQANFLFRLLNIPGSITLILLPYTLLLYGALLLRRCGVSPTRWARAIRLDAPMLFTTAIIAYTVIIGCTLEFSENMRFKFAVEAPMWAFMAATLYRRYRRPPLIP